MRRLLRLPPHQGNEHEACDGTPVGPNTGLSGYGPVAEIRPHEVKVTVLE